jgi:hypothetical protein
MMKTIEYCAIMSLYPYICKYGKFTTGHPVIHVGDTCKDVEACLKMEGIVKFSIVPPERLTTRSFPTDITRSYSSACVGRVCQKRTPVANVAIVQMPKKL